MDITTLALLAGIALVDSTSIGTLVVPLWLMLDRRRGAGNIALYLATVCAFYLVAGTALAYGGKALFESSGDALGDAADTTAGGVLVIAVGVALIAASFWAEPKRRQRAREARGKGSELSWGQRVAEREPTSGSTMTLAVAAGGLEIATMLPYLAAIGILASADISAPARTGVLAGYVVVMALPALLLLAVRQVLGDRVTGLLDRVRDWLVRNSAQALSIVLFVVGLHVIGRGVGLVS